ncbi:hypothetical protein OOT33_14455 [Sphingobium sp. DEHP117]|uniref:hypothetical protein n=1 Tax=Sphingobium sp. DEHP117 TaxID=2993436 RepID=UPI0027D62499|nr:hypothetical protein [Sphingobium sp. DEHP117]MDQ4421626.1 hypothetical protein [Sphingobium sp. DEHP117]
MTLQSSGPISLGNVAVELGRTSTTTTSLGEAAVRTLAGVASGPISLSNLYGKSNESFWYATFGSTVVNFQILGTDSSGNIYASASGAVFKWNRDGALIWAQNVSGPFINGGWVDTSGNVYLAGAYYSSNYYAWLTKLDTSGTLQWQRSLNSSGQELWYNAAVDAAGNIYVAGYSTSSGGSGNADALIAKYNSLGTLQWQRSIGGSGNEYANQMALSPDGSLLVLSGNTSTSTAGNTDALITVINTATPSVSWQRSIGSTGYDYGYGVTIDSSNTIYWLAGINGTLSLLKISSGAVIQWQLSLPPSNGSGTVNLGPDGNLRVFARIYAGADIYQFSTDGTLLLARSISLDTSNGANSFSLTGLAVSSTAMTFSIYTMMDFSPYGYTDLCGAIFKVPIDGSRTGTWSVGGASAQGVTYSASSPSISSSFWSLTLRSFSLLSRTLSAGTPSYAPAAGSYANTTTGI